MRTRLLLCCVAMVSFVSCGQPAFGEGWPHWRGPHFDGTAAGKGLPTVWRADSTGSSGIRWRHDLPGPAGSTPIVWDETIYVTSTLKQGSGLAVLAIGVDGTLRWRTDVDAGSVEVSSRLAHETNAAAPSPVTDGEHLWVLFGTSSLHRFDLQGKLTWSVDLAQRYGAPSLFFGLSTSPLLLGERIYLQLLHGDAQLVVALDKTTGDEVWKTSRGTDASGECLHAYTSVLPFASGEETLLLVHGADYLTAHDLDDGKERWRFGTLNPADNYHSTLRFVTTPVVHGDLIVVPTAKRGPVYGLRPGRAQGTLSPDGAQVVWTLERGTPDVPSPAVADGLVYLLGENGSLTVLDAATGEPVYQERVHQSPHRGSPIVSEGKVYLPGTDGTVSVVRAGRTFEVLAQNPIDAGRLAATPVVVHDVLYLRTFEALFAVGEPARAEAGAP